MLASYDPFSLEALTDPYPGYALLRDNAPVHHVRGRDIWAVSRHADADYVLRNHEVFSSTGGVGPEWDPHPMLSMFDPPEHTRLRRIVASRFTPRYTAGFLPMMRARADEVCDAFVARRGGDLVADVAEPIASMLIADLLGIPDERRAEFRGWSVAIVASLSDRSSEAAAVAGAARAEFVAFLRERIAARAVAPARGGETQEDIITLLLRASREGTLAPREITAFCVLLLVAGFETTANAISNIFHALSLFPSSWAQVTAASGPAVIEALIEEGLRYDSPDQSFFRNTLVDTTLAGVPIPARSKVMVLLGSANRDPRHVASPDTFDIGRARVSHLAFGSGIHHCLGAALARQQLAVLADSLRARVARFVPAGRGVRQVNIITRGFSFLPLAVEPR